MVQIQKTLKDEFGGGTKEFTVREVRSFVNPLEIERMAWLSAFL